MKTFVLFILWLLATGSALPGRLWAQTEKETTLQTSTCAVQGEELEVFTSYLNLGSASPQVVITQTEAVRTDIDTLNLQLAAQGRAMPPDVRADFKAKNKSACTIKRLVNISNLQFISAKEHDLIFRAGWGEFHKKYGKDAEILWLSRVGFNSDRTLALLHVSGGKGRMAAGGTLYLFERKRGKWVVKSQIQTWAT